MLQDLGWKRSRDRKGDSALWFCNLSSIITGDLVVFFKHKRLDIKVLGLENPGEIAVWCFFSRGSTCPSPDLLKTQSAGQML